MSNAKLVFNDACESVTPCRPSFLNLYMEHGQPTILGTYTNRIGDDWSAESYEWTVMHGVDCQPDDLALVRNGDRLAIRKAADCIETIGRVKGIGWFAAAHISDDAA